MDLIVRHARLDETPTLFDIGIEDGRIAAVGVKLVAEGRTIDVRGRLVTPGFIETHIHLDKACMLGGGRMAGGSVEKAIAEVSKAKRNFTPQDVRQRASRAIEKAILNGTTHMRTHLEVDPLVGLRSLEGVLAAVDDYRWAIDIEICIFPQEGLLNNPGTDELMVEALQRGGAVVGAAPYTDTDPMGQLARVFAIAREFDIDVDMHLDFSTDATSLDLDHVCRLTEAHKWGGRVTIGHVTKLSAVPPSPFAAAARRMADAGVALTVLPATDLYLMGRGADHNVVRGVTPAHRLLHHGVNCSLSTNNVLNPFTPFGDCSLIRTANLYANICQIGAEDEMIECFRMITDRAAAIMRLANYGVAVGNAADLVVIDAPDRATAIAEISAPLCGFKRGRLVFRRDATILKRPEDNYRLDFPDLR